MTLDVGTVVIHSRVHYTPHYQIYVIYCAPSHQIVHFVLVIKAGIHHQRIKSAVGYSSELLLRSDGPCPQIGCGNSQFMLELLLFIKSFYRFCINGIADVIQSKVQHCQHGGVIIIAAKYYVFRVLFQGNNIPKALAQLCHLTVKCGSHS